jgi:hypothetical protein
MTEYTEINDETKRSIEKGLIVELEVQMYQFEMRLKIEEVKETLDQIMIDYYKQSINERKNQIKAIKGL